MFIVGVPKAGTTSLHAALGEHPEVFMSTPKEPHYLAAPEAVPRAAYTLNAVRDEAAYLRLFEGASEPFRGESSTTNWWHPETAARIDAFAPGSRAIVVLRDPVDRAFSHYLNDCRDTHERRPFAATLPDSRPGPAALRWGDPLIRVELGFYAERLARYREVFGERLLILIFEDWVSDPAGALSRISRFLGLRSAFAVGSDGPRAANSHRTARGRFVGLALGSPTVRRVGRGLVSPRLRAQAYEAMMKESPKPAIEPAALELLRQLYVRDTTAVAEQLGRPLPWVSAAAAARTEKTAP